MFVVPCFLFTHLCGLAIIVLHMLLGVFGSAARGEWNPDSDVDRLVEFNAPATFDRYLDLEFFLGEPYRRTG